MSVNPIFGIYQKVIPYIVFSFHFIDLGDINLRIIWKAECR